MQKNELGEDVIFFEGTAAARSLRSRWTRLASTYDCIQVILSLEHLIIRPRLLLAALIRVLRLDLDHVVPTAQISGLERTGRFLSYGKLVVRFTSGSGEPAAVELYLREAEGFMEQIDRVMRRV
jgi:hypothetical protein